MEQNYKLLIGAGIGAGVGYFVGAVIVEVMRQHEELNNAFTNIDAEDLSDIVNKFHKQEEETTVPMAKKPREPKKNYAEYFQNAGRPDLAVLAERYNIKMPSDSESDVAPISVAEEDLVKENIEEEDETWVDDVAEADDSVDPRVISMEEYANDNEFTHVTLYYYEDDVLTNEKLQPINRPENILGEEALVSFGVMSGDEDIVYVRNLKKKVMYEVVYQNKPFSTSPVKKAIAKRASTKESEHGVSNS